MAERKYRRGSSNKPRRNKVVDDYCTCERLCKTLLKNVPFVGGNVIARFRVPKRRISEDSTGLDSHDSNLQQTLPCYGGLFKPSKP